MSLHPSMCTWQWESFEWTIRLGVAKWALHRMWGQCGHLQLAVRKSIRLIWRRLQWRDLKVEDCADIWYRVSFVIDNLNQLLFSSQGNLTLRYHSQSHCIVWHIYFQRKDGRNLWTSSEMAVFCKMHEYDYYVSKHASTSHYSLD